MRQVCLLCILTSLLIGCQSVGLSEPGNQAPENQSGKEIVIYGFDEKIWQMNSDGTNNMILVEADFSLSWPLLSPNGTRILLIGREDPKRALWATSMNGENLTQVSPEFNFINGYWINSEKLLVAATANIGDEDSTSAEYFILNLNDGSMNLYPHNFEGGVGRMIPTENSWISWWSGALMLHTLDGETKPFLHDWIIPDSKSYNISPSGQEIIFQGLPLSSTSEETEYGIYRSSIDASQEPVKILDMDCCVSFYWAPDGQKIAIFSPFGDSITIINSQTYETLNTFNFALYTEGKFGWSPSGKDFLVLADYGQEIENRNFELAKINLETGEVTRLTFNDKREIGAEWMVMK